MALEREEDCNGEETQARRDRCEAALGPCAGAQSKAVADAIRAIGVTEVTYLLALRPAVQTGCSTPTPVISPDLNLCWTKFSRCRSVRICAMTIPY
jgi:hypothetical protein